MSYSTKNRRLHDSSEGIGYNTAAVNRWLQHTAIKTNFAFQLTCNRSHLVTKSRKSAYGKLGSLTLPYIRETVLKIPDTLGSQGFFQNFHFTTLLNGSKPEIFHLRN